MNVQLDDNEGSNTTQHRGPSKRRQHWDSGAEDFDYEHANEASTSSSAPFRRTIARARNGSDNDESPMTPRKADQDKGSKSRLDVLTSSPHFPMHTPRNSREPSPGSSRNTSTRGRNARVKEINATEDESELQYEWQFEILNSLPREKAIALVNHLKAAEKERAQAARLALELSKTNNELHRRLRGQVLTSQGRSRCIPRWFVAPLSLLVLPLAAMCLPAKPFLDAKQLILRGLDYVRDKLADEGETRSPVSTAASTAASTEISDSFRGSSRSGESRVDFKDGKVRETTVREMMLRETTTREYDPKVMEQLQSENLQMKLQLERLWLDIDDAVHKGQDTVCWKV